MKKSWHPGLIKNRAQVWEDQHAALQERKRIEALRKEIEEERAANDLQRLNEANGGAKRQERVEFLYSGPGTGAAMMEDRDAYLLGRKRIDDVLGKDTMGQDMATQKTVPQGSAAEINLRDVARKVALDPLLAIRKQEAAQYEALINKKKAELELESRRAARKEARRSNDHDRHRSSRHTSSRRESRRDDSNERRDSRGHRSSRREHSDQYSSSRHDRERSPGRSSHRSSRYRHRSASADRPREESSSRSPRRASSRERRDSRRPGIARKRSRSPMPADNRSRTLRDHSIEPQADSERPRNKAKDLEDNDAARAAKLAEMTGAAAELDDVRAKRLEEARARDLDERTAESASRARESKVGPNSGYIRSMQMSAALVR